jgi:large subunit ribosomal protein L25
VTCSAVVKAMIVDWQHEPLKGALLHIDLKRIAMDKAMVVSVPVQLIGVPVGVKTQGGILEHVLREVEIECLPSDIPSHLDVDVSALEINGSVHVSDLPHTGSIKFITEDGLTVAHVSAIREEVVEPEAVDATAVPAEPEVAKKGKGETEGARGADAKTDAKADAKAEKSDKKSK